MFFFLLLYLKWPAPLHLKVVSIAGALSSAEASLCCREAGKKETEGARGIVHRALFVFLLLLFLLGYPPGGDAAPSGLIYLYFALLLARVASVSVLLRSKEQGTRVSPTGTLATHAMPLALWIVSGGVTFVCKHTHVNHHQNAPSSSDDKEEPTARRNG